MTDLLEVDIDGLTYRTVPESWIDGGEHHKPGSGAARRYATLAAVTDQETVRVRYVHPENSGVVCCDFETVDVDSGLIPELLVRHEVDWPKSILRDPWGDVDRAGAVRHGERDLLWELHGEWLAEETAYEREPELVADGGQRTIYELFWCDVCGGDREHMLTGWNSIGRPIWSCQSEGCDGSQVGPDRGHRPPASVMRGQSVATDGGER